MQNMKLFYTNPAEKWEETLPIGNGHLGAMIWGGVTDECIGVNEESLWSGYYL
jgi:alpha-L-fucosidase 2